MNQTVLEKKQVKLSEYPINGMYEKFGGKYVPEVLMPALEELESTYHRLKNDPQFKQELKFYFHHYGGRPTPLYFAKRLTEHVDGAKIYLKREDLVHGGAHKFNNAMGQGLLAKHMGKKRIIAETGAGQHGVAVAMIGAVLGIQTEIYMGKIDMERQALNVHRMKLLGAKVRPVTSGSQTLKDAINEALRDWVTNVTTTHYLIGSVVGPHPFPMIVRDFQSVIGQEIRHQLRELEGKELPDVVVACVGGGSNAAGTFYPFIDDWDVQLIGAEAGGTGTKEGEHGASLSLGSPGVVHGAFSYLMQDSEGQVIETHSISAGLDYPGVGPEHSLWKDVGRVHYCPVTDQQALDALITLSRVEGIIPALESAHAVHLGIEKARELNSDDVVVITISGRGDKDIETIIKVRRPQ